VRIIHTNNSEDSARRRPSRFNAARTTECAGHTGFYGKSPPGERCRARTPNASLLRALLDDLSFRVDGSTITLTGQVVRPTLNADAENALKCVEGVTSVINNMGVLPLPPDDDRIRRAAYRAIYGDFSLATRYGSEHFRRFTSS